jgi:hypothetical protein
LNQMMRGEAMLYHTAEQMAPDSYAGGFWEYMKLSNGSGYAAPANPARFQIYVCGNGYDGEMSSDAAGIVFTTFVLSSLMWEAHDRNNPEVGKLIEQFERLREFAYTHEEHRAILRALD